MALPYRLSDLCHLWTNLPRPLLRIAASKIDSDEQGGQWRMPAIPDNIGINEADGPSILGNV